jgi:CXXX repeat radical SAM target protein
MDEFKNQNDKDSTGSENNELNRRDFLKKAAGAAIPSFAVLGLTLSGCRFGVDCWDCANDCTGQCTDTCTGGGAF